MGSEKTYTLEYGKDAVHKDIPGLDSFWRAEMQLAITKKLAADPALFGKPLRWPLAGWRSMRVGSYRVVYEIRRQSIVYIIGILHRSDVYKEIEKRLGL